MLAPQRKPFKTISQGKKLIATARVEPARTRDAPELLGNTVEVRDTILRRAVVHYSPDPLLTSVNGLRNPRLGIKGRG